MIYLFDTNVLIYYMNGSFSETELETVDAMLEESFDLSIISKLEFLGWRGHTPESVVSAQAFIAAATIIQLDDTIANKVIELKRMFPIRLPDAIIAASAIVTNAILITRNTRDFNMISDIKLIDPFVAG